MAWITPPTYVAGAILTAAQMNAVSGDLAYLYTPPMVRVARTTGQSITSSTWTTIIGYAENYDTDGMWTSANEYLEIQTAGVYGIAYGAAFASAATGDRTANVSLNDATPGNTIIHQTTTKPSAVGITGISGYFVQSFAVADKLRQMVFQNQGSAVTYGTTGMFAYLSAVWIGKTTA